MPRIKSVLISLLLVMMLFFAVSCGEGGVKAGESGSRETSGTQGEETSVSEGEESFETDSPGPSVSENGEPAASPSENAETSQSASPSKSASGGKDYESFSGYLLDVKCGEAGKDTNGNSMKKNPEKHTVKCLKNKTRAAGGYGIAMKRSDGTYKFFKLDEDGNKMVKRYIIDKTKLKSGVLIAVRGTMEDDIIYVKTVLKYGLE